MLTGFEYEEDDASVKTFLVEGEVGRSGDGPLVALELTSPNSNVTSKKLPQYCKLSYKRWYIDRMRAKLKITRKNKKNV